MSQTPSDADVAGLVKRLQKPFGASELKPMLGAAYAPKFMLTANRADEICIERREAADEIDRLTAALAERDREVAELVAHVLDISHKRGCDGRCYSCSCGYDNAVYAAANALRSKQPPSAEGDG